MQCLIKSEKKKWEQNYPTTENISDELHNCFKKLSNISFQFYIRVFASIAITRGSSCGMNNLQLHNMNDT